MDLDIHLSQLQKRDQYCDIRIHTRIIMKQEHAYITKIIKSQSSPTLKQA